MNDRQKLSATTDKKIERTLKKLNQTDLYEEIRWVELQQKGFYRRKPEKEKYKFSEREG